MEPHEPLLAQLGQLAFLVTPIAIAVWLVRRRQLSPGASLGPGWRALGAWGLLAFGTLVVMVLAMGGHSGDFISNLIGAVMLLACGVLLWNLYWNHGVRERGPES